MADDWWEPTFLEEMKSLIEAYPQAGIYGSSYFKVRNGQYIPANIGVDKGFTQGLINYYKVYAKTLWMPLWTGAVMMPKQVYQALDGFKPALKLGEDFDLWVRIALKYSVAFLNKPLAYYNQDVEVENRGVILNKIYVPQTHFIFNLDYLEEDEKRNSDLKYLLDLLRVYTLFRYRMQRKYVQELNKELSKVDFKRQKLGVWLQYKMPIYFVKLFYNTKFVIKKILQ